MKEVLQILPFTSNIILILINAAECKKYVCLCYVISVPKCLSVEARKTIFQQFVCQFQVIFPQCSAMIGF